MKLWQSRKFRVLVLDTVVAIVVFVVTRFLAPDYQTDVLLLIGLLQPVVLAVILGTAWEDAAAKRAGNGMPIEYHSAIEPMPLPPVEQPGD